MYNDHIAVVASFDARSQVLSLIDGMNQICKLARRFLELTVTVGIGSPVDSLADLHHAADGARGALDYRVLMGSGRAIYIDDIEPDPAAQLQFDEQDERALLSAIKIGSPDDISRAVEQMIGCFRASRLPLGQYQLYFMEMMAELIKIIRTYQIDITEVFGPDFDGNFHLSRFDSLDALGSWFNETCLKISSLIRRERTNSSKAIAERAKQFIAENFANFDISVEMLCDHLHVSPAYFSTLFKKETGMSFVTYLTQVRMEEAIKLLSTTEDKTYEISLKVGYSEPNYFVTSLRSSLGCPRQNTAAAKEQAMVKAIRARIRQFFKAFQKRNIQYMISISFTIVAITGMLFLGMALYLRFAASTQNMVEEDNKRSSTRSI